MGNGSRDALYAMFKLRCDILKTINNRIYAARIKRFASENNARPHLSRFIVPWYVASYGLAYRCQENCVLSWYEMSRQFVCTSVYKINAINIYHSYTDHSVADGKTSDFRVPGCTVIRFWTLGVLIMFFFIV